MLTPLTLSGLLVLVAESQWFIHTLGVKRNCLSLKFNTSTLNTVSVPSGEPERKSLTM